MSADIVGQDLNLLTTLSNLVEETSGLVHLQGRIITHNDSGGKAALFEIDEGSGNVVREVEISNAVNKDWEDIESDGSYIYIGDFGNNNGTRKDLRIFKIGISDYLGADNRAEAEVIEYSYEDQQDFTSSPMATNFDAEALVSIGEFLYIFSKNWVDGRSHVYKLPKTPGSHSAKRIDELETNGLITGGSYNTLSGRIVLCGYAGFTPFLYEISQFSDENFSDGVLTRSDLEVTTGTSFQIEGVTYSSETRHLMSSEGNVLGDPALFDFSLNTLSIFDQDQAEEIVIYPNPTGSSIWINRDSELTQVEIFDLQGKLVLKIDENFSFIPLDDLPIGHYIVRLTNQSGTTIKKLIKE